jgi:phosphoglycerol geranylgeranyltransferase
MKNMKGRVEEYLLKKRRESPLYLPLIDPEKTTVEQAYENANLLRELGADAFLVGGSLGVDPNHMSKIVSAIKRTGLPIIIFPGDVTNIVDNADAILFMSLLNSDDPYYLIGAQVQGAALVRKYGLEPLPTGYIIIGYGGAAGFIGKARAVPWDHHYIPMMYSLAASMLGMRFVYLEAGSGSPRPVPPEMIRLVKKHVPELFVIVGGGIRSCDDAFKAVSAGADAVVTGTVLEESLGKAKEIVSGIKGSDNPCS